MKSLKVGTFLRHIVDKWQQIIYAVYYSIHIIVIVYLIQGTEPIKHIALNDRKEGARESKNHSTENAAQPVLGMRTEVTFYRHTIGHFQPR